MKDSFILHHDTLSVINELSDEQAGQLIKEMYSYSMYINNPKEAEKPTGLIGLMNSVLHPFKMQLDRDLDKYSNVVKRNSKNGLKGGRPKKEETQIKPPKPKKADSVSDSVKDSDKDKEKKEHIALENLKQEFDSIWKDYTLTFLKAQGRAGGTKKKALDNFTKLRKKYDLSQILNLVASEKKLKIGHKDLERVLRVDNLNQFIEDDVSFSSVGLVPVNLVGKDFKIDGTSYRFTESGYFNYTQDYEITNRQNVIDMVETIKGHLHG